MTAVPRIDDLTAVERVYLELVSRYGVPAPAAKVVDVAVPISDDGATDCWTHAWEAAQLQGAAYVEGVCVRPGAGGPSMHAWVEVATPLGRQVLERTPGYERATRYRGIRVDCSPGGVPARALRWAGPRGSTIQGLLASGYRPEQVLELLQPR